MTSFPTLEPVVVDGGAFLIDRQLDRAGHVEVGVGDDVTPETLVARTGNIEKSFTLYLANELGVANDSLKKYLAKSIGSAVNEGETIARVRRGLRTAAVRSPATGTIVHVDDKEGTVTLTASTGPRELKALVSGEVERIHSDRGVTIRTIGSRVYGIVGFGGEATGTLTVGIDRHDRELTADQVNKDWRGSIVLAGMTVGVPTLKRLRDAGVAGIIVGSISEADVRRFCSANAEDSGTFWASNGQWFAHEADSAPFVILVTEGFGRHQMAEPVFQFLASKAGSSVSMHGQTSVGECLSRPEIYITGDGDGAKGGMSSQLTLDRSVRLVDATHMGAIGTIESEPVTRAMSNGVQRDYVVVRLANGESHDVPAANVEVLS